MSTGTGTRTGPGTGKGSGEVAALQGALAAEQAAVWTYGLVTAFLPAAYSDAVQHNAATHRVLRDTAERLLRDAGATPRPAAVAYQPPQPINDSRGAVALVIVTETDTTVAWRAVIERTDNARLRRIALDAMTGAAVRETAWRADAGRSPAAPALPGTPG